MRKKIKINIKDLVVNYGVRKALEVKELSTSGGVIAIIGQNGSGKSTLIKTILDLLVPKSGTIEIFNQDKKRLKPENNMAFSPENGAVFADLKVESYLKLWSRIKCNNSKYYIKDGKHYLDRLGVTPLLTRFGRELSKGERRRVQTAIGFLYKPELFLFDEPFDGLDIIQSNQLMEIIEEESIQTAVLVSTHRMEIVERIADTVILLNKGQIVLADKVGDVCRILGGETIKITNLSLDFAKLIKNTFPSWSTNIVAGDLAITGKNLDPELLKDFLNRSSAKNYELKFQTPTLVDAMNFYFEHG